MSTKPSPSRIDAIDLARSLALLAMIVFHFTFDLSIFGLIAPDTVFTGGWPIFAQSIAASFLALAGISLWLAHGRGIRWQGFWRRWGILVLAALVVTVATYFGMEPQFIRWGILHMLAAGSLIGLAFLQLPVLVVILTAIACYLAPVFLQSEAFSSPWLLWLGLNPAPPPMMDFEPLLPWLAPVLGGIAFARLASMLGLWQFLWGYRAPTWMTWPGRHSLWIYLLHQPLLFGGFYLYLRFS